LARDYKTISISYKKEIQTKNLIRLENISINYNTKRAIKQKRNKGLNYLIIQFIRLYKDYNNRKLRALYKTS
jgi:hypothetical protein